MYDSIDKKASGNIDRQKCSPAALTLAIAAAVLGGLYIIFGYFISIYISPDGYGLDFTHPDVFGVIDIVLTLAVLTLLILYVIGVGRTPVLAASMFTAAAQILAGFVSIIIYATLHLIVFDVDISALGNVIIFFMFVFAGRNLIVNPAKIRPAAISTIIVIVLYAAMLILSLKTYFESVNEYAAVSSDYLIGSTISSSFYYLSKILFCLSIVMILRRFRQTGAEAPERQNMH